MKCRRVNPKSFPLLEILNCLGGFELFKRAIEEVAIEPAAGPRELSRLERDETGVGDFDDESRSRCKRAAS